MTTCEIRLDEQGMHGERTGGTTTLIAEVDDTSIHWGSHGSRGKTQPIVVVKVGALMIYLDEGVAGQARLRALHNHCYRGTPVGAVESTSKDRFDAAEAAAAADDYALAATIEPRVLFDAIVHDALTHLSRRMNLTILTGIVKATRDAVKYADESAFERGREDAKEQIRTSLGLATYRHSYRRGEMP